VARLIRFSGGAVAKANGLKRAIKSQSVDPKPGDLPMAEPMVVAKTSDELWVGVKG